MQSTCINDSDSSMWMWHGRELWCGGGGSAVVVTDDTPPADGHLLLAV